MEPFLSVIIPAFNDGERIFSTLVTVKKWLAKQNYNFELIVVDDGSADNTFQSITDFAANNPGVLKFTKNRKNMGKGYSVRKAVALSRGRYILFSDADLAAPIENLDKLITHIRTCDVAIGSRALKGSEIFIRQPCYREMLGKLFNFLVRLIVIRGILDTQCGFKLFRAKAAKKIFEKSRINRFCFDVEIVYIAKLLKYNINEIPISWLNSTRSHLNIFKDPLNMFLDLFYIRLNRILKRYS